MIWRLMDTYDLIKDLEGPFTSRVLCDIMLAQGMDLKNCRYRYCGHLQRLAKQGYLIRTGGPGRNGKTGYIYEVVKK